MVGSSERETKKDWNQACSGPKTLSLDPSCFQQRVCQEGPGCVHAMPATSTGLCEEVWLHPHVGEEQWGHRGECSGS